MSGFDSFDRRGYRSVGAREGYGLWAATYEQTIRHHMDLYAVFVYRVTGDELVKEATLVAVKAMDWRQRAARSARTAHGRSPAARHGQQNDGD